MRWVVLQISVLACLLLACGDGGNAVHQQGSLVYERLGSIRMDARKPVSISFSVSEGVDSFHLSLSELGDAFVRPLRIAGPDGIDRWNVAQKIVTNPVRGSDKQLVVQVPTHGDVVVSPGTWTIELESDADVSTQPVLVRRITPPDAGVLSLSLTLVGSRWLTEEPPVEIARLFQEVETLFALSDLSLEVETVELIGGVVGAEWERVVGGSGSGLPAEDIFSLQQESRQAVEVFLVDYLEPVAVQGAQVAWAGGSPGPALTPGTSRAGIVVAVETLFEGEGELEERIQVVALHTARALAQYLGLQHTTEANGEALYTGEGSQNGADFLASTPVCPDSQDLDGDLFLTWSECAALDGNNLLFWKPVSSSKELTEEQGKQLYFHPLVH